MARQRLAELGDDAAIRMAILDAARALVRRHGAAKVNVSDVSRALGISHSSLYRHFTSKADLIDALGSEAMVEDETLVNALVARSNEAALPRLRDLAQTLHRRKCERFHNDVEVHLLYERVARERPDLVHAFARRITEALADLIAQGVQGGELLAGIDPLIVAGVFRDSLTTFVHPILVAAEGGLPATERLDAVLDQLIAGIRAKG